MRTKSEWEDVFGTWSRGPQKTETERIERSKKMINEAIKEDEDLSKRNIKVFVQGSYRNSVNVKKDSDIDIGVLCNDTFFDDYVDSDLREYHSKYFKPGTYNYSTFKNDVQRALVNKFGKEAISRGNKSFDIKASSVRVEADVAPFFEHRRYYDHNQHYTGVQMVTDHGTDIINWPEQHYENGVIKHRQTDRRFKKSVRILKKLKNSMENDGYIQKNRISGFFIECLVWNVPNRYFDEDSHYDRLGEIMTYLYNKTSNNEIKNDWGEVSDLMYLFRGPNRSVKDANDFLQSALRYVGYE